MKQKTSVCRKTTSPRWESALSWDDLSLADLSERCLELTVWDHDRIGHNDILGGVRFNLGTGMTLLSNCLWQGDFYRIQCLSFELNHMIY